MLMFTSKQRMTSRESLKGLYTPAQTDTWSPVPHSAVADALVNEATRRGLPIREEQWTLMDGALYDEDQGRIKVPGGRMFGAIDFGEVAGYRTPKGTTLSMGIRTSVDKTYAHTLLLGARIGICTNGILIGEYELRRKHTSGFDLEQPVQEAFDNFLASSRDLEMAYHQLTHMPVNNDRGRLLAVELAESGAIPSSYILPVVETFEKPPHSDFEPRNGWSFYNAATEVMKRQSPARQTDGFLALNRVMLPTLGVGQN